MSANLQNLVCALLVPLFLLSAGACAEDSANDTSAKGAGGGGKEDSSFAIPEDEIVLPVPGQTVLAVTQPRILASLEEGGLHMSHLFSLEERGTKQTFESNQAFAQNSPWYSSVAEYVSGELDTIGEGGRYTYGADAYVNRLFHKGWLSSPYAHLELSAIVNRVDRKDFHAALGEDTCGEVRFLYRLSYSKPGEQEEIYSRMPLVFNVVYNVRKGSGDTTCQDAVARWRVGERFESPSDYVAWLQDVLALGGDSPLVFSQVEMNFQAVRIPSESKDDLGGHAEYMMRIFRPQNGRLAPVALENTPDAARIAGDPALKAELLEYIRTHIDEIEAGVYQIPEHLLAYKATSFTTHGLHRQANRPFSRIFEPAELSGIDFEGTQTLASPEALLLKLDDGSCTGCHQGNSTAGFHFLGHDRVWLTHPLNAVRLPGSAHFTDEQRRRTAYSASILAGQSPDTSRPLSFQPFDNKDEPAGGRCFVADDLNTHFKGQGWGCEGDNYCRIIVEDQSGLDVGTCVRPSDQPVAGDPCFQGDMVSDPDAPREDTLSRSRFGCTGYACLKPEEGTPLGLCYAQCLRG